MEKQIREIIEHHVGGTYEAKQKCAEEILRLFRVSVQCEHPYNSVMKGNAIRPTQCFKCGKALSEHSH